MSVVLSLCIFFGFFSANCAAGELDNAHGMRFTVAQWAYEVRGEDDYDLNPEGTFARGERGYAYLEIADFGVAQDDTPFFFLQLDVDVALETKNGLRLFSQEDVLELKEWYVEPPETTWFYIYVDIPWWAPRGVYRTLITVRDGITDLCLEEVREIVVH